MYITRNIKANKTSLSSNKLQEVINKCVFVLLVPVLLITVMWIHCHINCQVLIRYDNCVSTNICVLQKTSGEVASIMNMQNLHFHFTTTGNIQSHDDKMQEKLKCGKSASCDISIQNSQQYSHCESYLSLVYKWNNSKTQYT
jgi:hypothetical protein